jgi:hypothetical protein
MIKDLVKNKKYEIIIFLAMFVFGFATLIYGIIKNDELKVLSGLLPMSMALLITMQILQEMYYENCLRAQKKLINSYEGLRISYEEGIAIKDQLIENYKKLYLNAREQVIFYEKEAKWQKEQKSTDKATI